MYYRQFVSKNQKKYDNYSIFEKTDLLLSLYRVFNLLLVSARKMRETRDLDFFEEEAWNHELHKLKEDIWRCENEIILICEDTTDTYILEKVKAAQINRMPHDRTEHEPIHDDLVQSLKRFLLSISLYSLQIKELKKRKSTPDISDYEKNILTEIVESLELKIEDNYHDIHYMERWKVPAVFRQRREIIDAIEDSEIEASEVLPPGRSCITVDYLKDEENGSVDLRKWETKKWLAKRYDMFRSPRRPFLDYGYIFNFQALINEWSFFIRLTF